MLLTGAALVFAQIGLTVTAPDTITARVPATVRVAIASPVSWAHELVVPKLPPGYALVRVGMETRVDSAGRRSWWKTSEHELQLTAARAGALYLPGFEVRSGALVTRSKPRRIVVRAGAPDVVPEIVSRAPLDESRAVDFHGMATPARVYVGQQATYQVGVFLDDEVRFRLRRNPEFHPPELRSAVAYDLPGPVGNPPVRQLGTR
ncbi:MAG TPA: hypothetical protein VKA84_12535, partial [Gemmatimonadaceae bacterium]|nr:hypothetical protein [Gemmatimonadaceae bacterium]